MSAHGGLRTFFDASKLHGMKAGSLRSELLVVESVFNVAGRLLIIDPDFCVPEQGWKACSVEATIMTPDGKQFDWPLALEISRMRLRIHPYVIRRVVPCFRNLSKSEIPIGSQVLIQPDVISQLTG